jgi:hypothetical protein
MLVVKLCGLGGMRVCMSSRWRAFVVPFHDRWLSLQLDRSVAVKSSIAANGNRIVVLTRSRKSTTAKHYTFDPSTTVPLPIITARGCGMVFAQYHCGHGLTVLIFFKAEKPTGVCHAEAPLAAAVSATIGVLHS